MHAMTRGVDAQLKRTPSDPLTMPPEPACARAVAPARAPWPQAHLQISSAACAALQTVRLGVRGQRRTSPKAAGRPPSAPVVHGYFVPGRKWSSLRSLSSAPCRREEWAYGPIFLHRRGERERLAEMPRLWRGRLWHAAHSHCALVRRADRKREFVLVRQGWASPPPERRVLRPPPTVVDAGHSDETRFLVVTGRARIAEK